MTPSSTTHAPHAPVGTPDLALVRAAAAGSRQASAALLLRLTPRVRAIARAMTRDAVEAEDATQVAMLELWQHLSAFDGDGAFVGWVSVLARRRIGRHLYRARRNAAREVLGLPQEPSAPERDPGERVWLAGLLRTVPRKQQEALWLHHGCGMHIDEVATRIGAPANTVKSRMRVALATLRSLERAHVPG